MGKIIPFATLTEYENEDGDMILHGRFGMAELVGRCTGTTEDGRRIWRMAIEESEHRMRARKEYQRRRKGQDNG